MISVYTDSLTTKTLYFTGTKSARTLDSEYSSNLKGLFWNDANLYMILLLSIRLLEMICFLGEPWEMETETRMRA